MIYRYTHVSGLQANVHGVVVPSRQAGGLIQTNANPALDRAVATGLVARKEISGEEEARIRAALQPKPQAAPVPAAVPATPPPPAAPPSEPIPPPVNPEPPAASVAETPAEVQAETPAPAVEPAPVEGGKKRKKNR